MKKFFQENWKSILLMAAAGFAMPVFVCSSCLDSFIKFMRVGSLNAVMWIALWMGNAYLGRWVDTKISWIETPVTRFIVGMVSMTVYTIGIIYVILKIFEWVLNLKMLGENLTDTFQIAVIITFVIIIITILLFILIIFTIIVIVFGQGSGKFVT